MSRVMIVRRGARLVVGNNCRLGKVCCAVGFTDVYGLQLHAVQVNCAIRRTVSAELCSSKRSWLYALSDRPQQGPQLVWRVARRF